MSMDECEQVRVYIQLHVNCMIHFQSNVFKCFCSGVLLDKQTSEAHNKLVRLMERILSYDGSDGKYEGKVTQLVQHAGV